MAFKLTTKKKKDSVTNGDRNAPTTGQKMAKKTSKTANLYPSELKPTKLNLKQKIRDLKVVPGQKKPSGVQQAKPNNGKVRNRNRNPPKIRMFRSMNQKVESSSVTNCSEILDEKSRITDLDMSSTEVFGDLEATGEIITCFSRNDTGSSTSFDNSIRAIRENHNSPKNNSNIQQHRHYPKKGEEAKRCSKERPLADNSLTEKGIFCIKTFKNPKQKTPNLNKRRKPKNIPTKPSYTEDFEDIRNTLKNQPLIRWKLAQLCEKCTQLQLVHQTKNHTCSSNNERLQSKTKSQWHCHSSVQRDKSALIPWSPAELIRRAVDDALHSQQLKPSLRTSSCNSNQSANTGSRQNGQKQEMTRNVRH